MRIANTSRLIFPDANVMIKWCVREEEDREQVEKMQEDFVDEKIQIVSSGLVEWELNNYLGRKFSENEAARKYSYFKLFQFTQIFLNLEISSLAFKIMKKCPGVTFYDASYHSMGLLMKGLFLTADKKYYERAKSFGNIKLLKDY